VTHPLRVLVFLRVADGAQDRFLAAYESIRHRVAAAPGHLGEELGQSPSDPRNWLLTSEWETPEHYRAWARQAGFAELSDPIVAVTESHEHRAYLVRLCTPERKEFADAADRD